MDCNELSRLLQGQNIPSDWYCIGRFRRFGYSLVREEGLWKICTCTRGCRNTEDSFASEEEACHSFYDLMMFKAKKRSNAKSSF